jgi:glycosyltransferase involved in cell wall biosynthesis
MTNQNNKPILVAMPVYNAMPFLAEAVASILNQSFSDFIFLAIDDSSTDGSFEFLLNQKDKRVRVVQQKHAGPGAAMNIAIEYAQKNNIAYIARMDADDISSPQRLEMQLYRLDSNPALAAVSCNCDYIDLDRKIIGKSTVPISSKTITWEIRNGLRGLVQGACIFRTSALVSVGGYNPQIPQAEDTDLFLRLSESFQFSNLSEVYYQIRINPLSLSISNSEQNIRYHLYVHRCFTRHLHRLPELSFVDHCNHYSLLEKIRFNHEKLFLRLWRKGMQQSNPLYKFLAGMISPKRVVARLFRLFETKSQ